VIKLLSCILCAFVLWNQQLQVAIYTAPNAIERTVGTHKMALVPATSTPPVPADASQISDAAE